MQERKADEMTEPGGPWNIVAPVLCPHPPFLDSSGGSELAPCQAERERERVPSVQQPLSAGSWIQPWRNVARRPCVVSVDDGDTGLAWQLSSPGGPPRGGEQGLDGYRECIEGILRDDP